MKKNKKVAIGLCLLLLVSSVFLSGCISKVKTNEDWRHSKRCENGVIISGSAPEKYEGHDLIEVMFVRDTKPCDNWEEYEYTVEDEDIIKQRTFSNTRFFEGEICGLNIFEPLYFRAVAKYRIQDGSEEGLIKPVEGEEVCITLN